jgi:UDP-glucose 6-dehydrogenase
MKTNTQAATTGRVVDDTKNEVFQTLLREAAEKREERQRLSSLEEAEATRLESAAFLALARDRAGVDGR